MSSVNTGRIKQIRKRTGAKQYLSVPIGADGILIDMLSELDLEEEIKLGGNHYVEIVQTNIATEIKEWYFSKPKGNKTIEEMSNYVTYSASVVITSFEDQNICIPPSSSDELQEWIWGETTNDAIVDRKPISSDGSQTITMTLYKKDMDREGIKLHEKVISFYENPLNNEIIIDEQITYPESEPEGGNEP